MTELAKHIEILLLDNDCVIVPGFGGFMAHHAVSVYDEEECLFYPPTRTLGFNPQLKINDSLLAQSYVEAYDISYPEALRRIEDDVREVRQHISSEGFCELPDVGVLSINDEGNFDFSPSPSGILSPGLYALDSFEMKPLAQAKAKKQEVPVVEEANVDEACGDSILPVMEDEDDRKPMVISINVEKLRHVATAAAVLLFFIIMSMPLGIGTRTSTRLCSLDSGILMRIMPGMEVNGSLPTFKETKDTIAPAAVQQDIEEATPEVPVVAEKRSSYVIVLAAMVSKGNADVYVSKLQQSGYEDARVIESAHRKVVCGDYGTMEEAQSHLNSMREGGNFQDAWILEI